MVQTETLTDVEMCLIKQAIVRHRIIYPCGDRRDFSDCFTRDGRTLMFWFNTEDLSTHLITTADQAS